MQDLRVSKSGYVYGMPYVRGTRAKQYNVKRLGAKRNGTKRFAA